ncbi:MAG: TetR family transcriptional regulator [Solirubrobacteraceae bacterium]
MAVVAYQTAARELLQQTLLDAGHALLKQRVWSAITMGEIARDAGVSRQTLYSAFGTREDFARALVLREGDRFVSLVERAIRANAPDAELALTAAFDVFLGDAARDPLIRSVIAAGDGPDTLLPLLTIRGRPLLERCAERLADVIESCWEHVPSDDARRLSECIVRLAISFAALPPAAGPGAAEEIASVLAPYVRELTQD